VVDAGTFNERFRDELRPLVTAAGCTLVEGTIADIWMQDCMEFGFANLPGAGVRSVMRAPRNRPLKSFPKTLLDADVGYFEVGTLAPDTTYDSTGNLEATPPVTSAAGKHFPLGRIYFGPGLAPEVLDPDVHEFLRAQVVQAPIELDTNWLTVGHVDEVLSIVPAPDAVGFKLLVASPELGYRILDTVKATDPTAKMLLGRTFPTDTAGAFDVEQTVAAFLSLADTFHPDLSDAISSGHISYTAKPLRDYNADRQKDIDRMQDTMVAGLGLSPVDDVIHIPAIMMPNPSTPSLADALVAGMVNMLVVNKHCIVPKPFGPVVGGVDQFEKDVQDKLTPLGLTVNFLDCWHEYHVNLGEVHCGTNTLRAPTAAPWWEFQP
jgi:protein-arginine deiminase